MKKILLLAVAIFAQVTFAQDMSKYIPDLKPGETAPEISFNILQNIGNSVEKVKFLEMINQLRLFSIFDLEIYSI